MRRILLLTIALVCLVAKNAFSDDTGLLFNITHSGFGITVNTTKSHQAYPWLR